ncbi:ABC transporter ATP-binding protein [Apibacter muscae]|uniref:ABC transporter ATP-binding protein n=1 Tax=Apibacter muscae TaxID=2509004 RepID=UPI0011ABA7B3|nr:ABC transporter ATP-binding protein [Apibacter muscae]TWP27957.1 ABC transporter ATP-binding protein [Apibacter muscae]
MKELKLLNKLQINNLSIGYKSPLLSNINMEAKSGEVILLIGRNGTGKTTFLKTLLKELAPLKGKIEINGKDLKFLSATEISMLISVVLSKINVSPFLKVYDLVALGRFPYKKWYQNLSLQEKKTIEEILNLLNLTQYQHYYIHQLSDGNLQKAMIARALIQDTPFLIMDEPTSHLDIANKLEVMKIIHSLAKEKGKIVLFTSHDLSLGLSIADQVALIRKDKFKIGFTEDLAKNENILDHFAGKDITFNYISNEYEFISVKNKREISLVGDSQSLYWLKKALIRKGFYIVPQGELLIREENSKFIVQKHEQDYSFSTVEEVIRFLS